MPSPNELRELNFELFDQLGSNDPSMVKNAQNAVDKFVRLQVREEGILRKCLSAISVDQSDLDIQASTDKPCIVGEMEPASPGAVSVPFATTPTGWYVQGRKFLSTFDRILGPRFVKDLSELRTYRSDIRQIISDNSLRDILALEDSRFFYAWNSAMGGVPGGVSPLSGAVQWGQTWGGVSRDAVAEAKKILPSTFASLEATTAIVNTVTVNDFIKWGADEADGANQGGGMLMSGTVTDRMLNMDWIRTFKKHLVPNGTIFFMADPDFVGKFYVMEDITLAIKREEFMIEWWPYCEQALTIANAASLARNDFL